MCYSRLEPSYAESLLKKQIWTRQQHQHLLLYSFGFLYDISDDESDIETEDEDDIETHYDPFDYEDNNNDNHV